MPLIKAQRNKARSLIAEGNEQPRFSHMIESFMLCIKLHIINISTVWKIYLQY